MSMKRWHKWTLTVAGGLIVLASGTIYWMAHRLPDSAVRLCETAFGAGLDRGLPASLTTEKQEDDWIAAREKEQQQALGETAQLVKQPGMVTAMKGDLAVNKGDALRYASIAYVLGYNGIDPAANVHRLRVMVDPDPADTFQERLATIADPEATDDTVDAITGQVFDICERQPTPDVLREAVTMRSDGGPGEIIGDGIDNLLMQHSDNLLEAIDGQPNAELNVAFQLNIEASADTRIGLRVMKECHSSNRHHRAAARYIAGYMAHPFYPKKWLEG